MKAVYTALLKANGYYTVQVLDSTLLIYTTPYNLQKIDFTGLNLSQINEKTIDLRVITDYELHQSSEGKQGFSFVTFRLSDLGDFKSYP